jgi:hypothetical protein
MKNLAPTIERAFQLAKTSRNINDLRGRLRLEGYPNAERDLFGSALRKELQELMRKDWPT